MNVAVARVKMVVHACRRSRCSSVTARNHFLEKHVHDVCTLCLPLSIDLFDQISANGFGSIIVELFLKTIFTNATTFKTHGILIKNSF